MATGELESLNAVKFREAAALTSDNPVSLKLFLSNGLDINAADQTGLTALHTACLNGNSKVVRYLLESGADVTRVTIHGQTALHLAASHGHEAAVRLLLAHPKVQLDVQASNSGHTALHYASRSGHASICYLLIQAGATKGKLDFIRKPPKAYAANKETTEVFEDPEPSSKSKQQGLPEGRNNVNLPPTREKNTDETTAFQGSRGIKEPDDRSHLKVTKLHDQEEMSNNAAHPPMGSKPQILNTSEKSPRISNESDDHMNATRHDQEEEERRRVELGARPEMNTHKIIDKKFEFSEEYKKKMKQSVFDRLGGGKRKTNKADG